MLKVEEPKRPSVDPRDTPDARIAAARTLAPETDPNCRLCWDRGRDEAIRLWVAGDDAAARSVMPSGHNLHCYRSWSGGRDAALALLLGE